MVKIALLGALAGSLFQLAQAGYDASCGNNIVTYDGNGAAPNEQNLKYYCSNEKSYADVFVITFVYKRDSSHNPVFASDEYECSISGDCSGYGKEVQYCQSLGKTVLISIGGATGNIVFSSTSDAQSFAKIIWNTYLGGTGKRPFGSGVVFDGVDLDAENNNPKYWGDFTTELRSLFTQDTSRKYLISAAPQPEPIESADQNLVNFLETVWVDFCFIQFYNNPGYDEKDTLSMFAWWTSWATGKEKSGHNSKNPKVKLIYGLPGSSNSGDAGQGYQSFSLVQSQVAAIQKSYPQAFAGGGTWDDAWSYENKQGNTNFLQNFKTALGPCSGSSKTKTKAKTKSAAANRVAINSTQVDPSATFYNLSTLTVKDTAGFKITAIGLKNAKGPTGVFQLRIHTNTPILKNWTLMLPKRSQIVSSSIGTVKRYRNGIEITSVSTKSSLTTLRFTVTTRGGILKLDLSSASFKTW